MVPRSLLILAKVVENFLLYSMASLSERLILSREFIISLRGSIEVLANTNIDLNSIAYWLMIGFHSALNSADQYYFFFVDNMQK